MFIINDKYQAGQAQLGQQVKVQSGHTFLVVFNFNNISYVLFKVFTMEYAQSYIKN